MNADELGRLGEDLAEAFYRVHGYRMRDRRWRRAHGEIDLIVERGDVTVFVEIKARGPGSYGRACEAVSPRQLARLRALVGRWCVEHAPRPRRRLDVVTLDVLPEGQGLVLRQIRDVR
jgi:putative endonuclease